MDEQDKNALVRVIVDEVTGELRTKLLAMTERYGPLAVLTAISYEYAAMIARHATTLELALIGIDVAAETAKQQIAAFGLGVHP